MHCLTGNRSNPKGRDLEMEALENNSVWELVSLPNGKKPVGCKWVYTVKYKVGSQRIHSNLNLCSRLLGNIYSSCKNEYSLGDIIPNSSL
jgi:hypothetical protein